jgi:hypothetical protein
VFGMPFTHVPSAMGVCVSLAGGGGSHGRCRGRMSTLAQNRLLAYESVMLGDVFCAHLAFACLFCGVQ